MERDNGNKKAVTVDIASLDLYVLLTVFINILSAQAWQHMGLRVKAGTDKVEQDLQRARIAIDCITFIIDKLESHIQESEINKLKTLLTDLQMNFVRIQKN